MDGIILCLAYKSEQIRGKLKKPPLPLPPTEKRMLAARFLPAGFSHRTVVKQLPKTFSQHMHSQREHMGATTGAEGRL